MFRIISKALAGYNTSEERPSSIDLRYEDTVSNSWVSGLNRKIPVSGRYYGQNQNGEWVSKMTAVLSYAQIIVGALSHDDFRLYLQSSNNNDMAWISVAKADLQKVTAGTQAIIEWTLKVSNMPSQENVAEQ